MKMFTPSVGMVWKACMCAISQLQDVDGEALARTCYMHKAVNIF